MSDTPRTDRRIITQQPKMCGCSYSCEIINADFARRLERELNAAKELIREIRDNEVNAVDEATKFLRDYPINEHNK